jgi:hypothetical protein
MSDFRTQLRGLSDEQAADVYREVELDRARRAPKRELNDLSDREFFRHADELCRQADREKLEKSDG